MSTLEMLFERADERAAAPPAGRPRAGRLRRPVGWLLAVLVGQALVLSDVRVPVLRPLLGAALLLGVPALVLVRRRLHRLGDPLAAVLYAVGAAVLGVVVGALLLNTVLPWAGASAPLARPVLVAASTAVDIALLWPRSAVPLVPATAGRAALRTVLRARLDPAVALGVGAVVLAVAGAVRLNNGLGGGVAVLAHATAVAALAWAALRCSPARARNPVVVYLAGLALLLGTSLRGWYVTGHDIQNEYLSFLYTQHAHHWVMSAYPTPYNACLSVNILPSVLVDYLGVSGVVAFKIVLQLLFALVPVCVYALARRMIARRLAVLAAALFVFFPTFFTDMPYLVRQEVAYLFVALALLAATQPRWPLRMRQAATFAFGVGVILSHYATTYVLIITLFLGLAGVTAGALARGWRERRLAAWTARARHARPPAGPRRGAPLVLLRPLVVVGLAVTAWAWSSPATHSDGHLADTVNQLTESIMHGNATAGSSDLKYSPLGGGGPTAQQRFDDYLSAAAKARAASGAPAGAYVFPRPSGAVADPPLAERDYLPLTALGRLAADAGVNVRGGNALLRGASGALYEVLLGIGLLALLLRARSTRRIGREQFWLALGSVGALGAVVVVPGLSADYGVLRAFQQTLLFAAPLAAVGLAVSVTWLRRAALPAAVAVATSMGWVLTGAQPALVGGYYAQVSQSNSGQYYDLLYVAAPEQSAAHWLAGVTAHERQPSVAASDIVSVTRLQGILPKSVTVTGDYLPLQLTRGSYVFLGPQTAVRGQATVFYTGDLLTYRYPTGALDTQLDLVYSTSGTRIYR